MQRGAELKPDIILPCAPGHFQFGGQDREA